MQQDLPTLKTDVRYVIVQYKGCLLYIAIVVVYLHIQYTGDEIDKMFYS
jgi:hypothetical protein